MTFWIEIAGWTLVHFTWQGALAGCAGAAALHLLRRSPPQARYATACAVLASMLALPVVTARTIATRTAPASVPFTPAAAPAAAASAPAWAEAVSPTPSRPAAGLMAMAASPGASRTGWLPFVVLAWLAGVVLLTSRMAGGWMRVRRLHRASIGAPPSQWEDACSRIGTLLGVQRFVRVVDSPFVDTPTVLGCLRPVILLPVAALANLSPAQVDAILAHEIAHVRRHDYLVNLFQAIAETLLFYHPAVWWISARIREEREHCCDVVAVGICGDAVSYAEALTELETWRTSSVTIALAATGGSLLARIRRLLAAPADDTPRVSASIPMAALALTVVIAAAAALYVTAAEPQARQDAATPAPGAAGDAVSWRMVFRHASGELLMMGYTARDLIRFAYQVPKARVLGGPAWLDEEASPMVVDLDGPIGAGLFPNQGAHISQLLEAPAADQMPSIIRRVLEDRYQLQVRMERRDLPAYALALARPDGTLGPNLRVSTIDCFDREEWIAAGQPPREIRPDVRQPLCGEEDWNSGIARTSYIAITMPQLAASMGGFARMRPRGIRLDPGLDAAAQQPLDVVDRTGLTGRYDVEIHALLPAVALMAHFPVLRTVLEPIGFPSMPRALERQLGLKLVETTAPYDVIVIDHAERPAG